MVKFVVQIVRWRFLFFLINECQIYHLIWNRKCFLQWYVLLLPGITRVLRIFSMNSLDGTGVSLIDCPLASAVNFHRWTACLDSRINIFVYAKYIYIFFFSLELNAATLWRDFQGIYSDIFMRILYSHAPMCLCYLYFPLDFLRYWICHKKFLPEGRAFVGFIHLLFLLQMCRASNPFLWCWTGKRASLDF